MGLSRGRSCCGFSQQRHQGRVSTGFGEAHQCLRAAGVRRLCPASASGRSRGPWRAGAGGTALGASRLPSVGLTSASALQKFPKCCSTPGPDGGPRVREDCCHRQANIAWRGPFRKEERKTQRSTRESGLQPWPLVFLLAVPFPVPGPSLCAAPPPTLSSVPSPSCLEWWNSSPRSSEGLALHRHTLSAHILVPKSPLQT